jgi:hypothetical protein
MQVCGTSDTDGVIGCFTSGGVSGFLQEERRIELDLLLEWLMEVEGME